MWAVVRIGLTVLGLLMPPAALGPRVGIVHSALAAVCGYFGWKYGSALAPPRRLDKAVWRCIRYGVSLLVVYLALEVGLPQIGLHLPIIYSSRQWFWGLVAFRGLILGSSFFMFAWLFALLDRGPARRA
jgi:hypothetical protein